MLLCKSKIKVSFTLHWMRILRIATFFVTQRSFFVQKHFLSLYFAKMRAFTHQLIENGRTLSFSNPSRVIQYFRKKYAPEMRLSVSFRKCKEQMAQVKTIYKAPSCFDYSREIRLVWYHSKIHGIQLEAQQKKVYNAKVLEIVK